MPEPTADDRVRAWFVPAAGGACAALLAFALYAVTCAPGVLWGDSATYQVRIATGQLESPLGLALTHPLYIVLARAFSRLTAGDIAWRVNLFSATCAAAAVGLLFQFLRRVCGSALPAAAGCAMLAVSHTYWTHAVTAEVYALYALALAGELCMVERFFATGRREWIYAALCVNGLSTCNHLLALLHLPAYGVLAAWLLIRRTGSWMHLIIGAAAWAAGASLYLAMIAAQISVRGDALGVVREALTGRAYASRIGGSAFSWLTQAARTAQAFLLNFPTPVVLFAILGIRRIGRRVSPDAAAPVSELDSAARVSKSRAAKAISDRCALFLCGILLVNLGFGFVYRVPDQYVFFFPSYICLAALSALGVSAVRARSGWITRRAALVLLLLALLPAAAYEIAPPICERWHIGLQDKRKLAARNEYAYFLRPRKNGDTSAADFCAAALRTAGPGGYLLADSTIKSPLVYVRDVLGVGRDVVLEAAWYSEVTPAPPTAAKTPQTLRRYALAGRAYICDATPGYYDALVARDYQFVPIDRIWRLTPR